MTRSSAALKQSWNRARGNRYALHLLMGGGSVFWYVAPERPLYSTEVVNYATIRLEQVQFTAKRVEGERYLVYGRHLNTPGEWSLVGRIN